MATPRKNNHVSSNSPTKYEDYIMNLSPLRPTTSSSISTHINLLSSSSLSPSLIVHRITSVEELRFQTDSGGPGLSTDLVPRRTSRRRCLFSETAAAVSGSKAGDDVKVGATRSLSRAVSALAGLNWEDKSSMNPLYLNHVISLWRDLIPTGYAYAAPSSSSVQEEEERDVPAKKRTKLEHDTETRSCKRCSCRKSRCLKLYCECFGSGNYCTGPCLCHNCLNKPIFKDKVLEARSRIESRNPLAFAPKLIGGGGIQALETPASNKHRQGCKCKRSSCLKKYCECFQAGVGCSFNCRCQGCKNPLGCKHEAHSGSIRGESNILNGDGADNRDTIMNHTRRHVLGAALLTDSEESRIFGTCHNVPAKMQQHDIDVPHLSAPHILKSSSPNGKRVSLPRATLWPILQQP